MLRRSVAIRALDRLSPALLGVVELAPRLKQQRASSERREVGRPRRERFLLRPGELASAFPSLIVEHYAELEPAGGPVTARLLARKPG